MLNAITIHSDAIDTEDVVAELLACEPLGYDGPVAGVLFVSSGYDIEAIVAAVNARFPGIALVGCTANGTLSWADYYEDGVLLAVLYGPGVSFEVGVGRELSSDVAGVAGAAAAAASREAERPALVLTFADALNGDMAAAVDGVTAFYGDDVPPIFGGTAADQWAFERTFQFARDEVVTNALVVLACYGPLAVGGGVDTGWKPIGAAMRVTDSAGALVRTVDDVPLREVLERHFPGFEVDALLDHPLAVFPDPAAPDDFYLRALLTADPETGAVIACGSVEQGAEVRLTTSSSAEVIAAAASSADGAIAGLESRPDAVLVFSCAARQTVLGIECDAERRGIRERLAARGWDDVPVAGFYSYGEIGAAGGSAARFHNETCVVVTLRGEGG